MLYCNDDDPSVHGEQGAAALFHCVWGPLQQCVASDHFIVSPCTEVGEQGGLPHLGTSGRSERQRNGDMLLVDGRPRIATTVRCRLGMYL